MHVNFRSAAAVAIAAAFIATGAGAMDIPKGKATKAGLYLTAGEAATMLEDTSVVLVDIRSRGEVAFLGLPTRANVHIPYMEMPMVAEYSEEAKGYELELNPDFPMAFKSYAADHGLGTDTPIVLMCRSGTRSAKAADLLTDMGYTRVYSLIDGYEGDKAGDGPHRGQRVVNGWKNAGLEWSYAIAPAQAYPLDR